MSANITLTGRLVADPDFKFGAGGMQIVKLRVVTSGRKKTDDGWQDIDTTFWSVTAFRQLAENITETLSKGDEVIIVGKVKSREYETPDGEKRTITEVTADDVGANLKRVTAKLHKIQRTGKEEFQASKANIADRPPVIDDPWTSPDPIGF